MEPFNIKDILELGTTGVLAVGVIALWQRLGVITDKMFVYLEHARLDREQMQRELANLRNDRTSTTG